MASTQAKAVRRADVLQRLSDRLGIQQGDLNVNGRGDSELAMIVTLERIADAVDKQTETQKKADQEPQGDLRQAIANATDDELIALPGIGDKSVEQLRAWATEATSTPQEGQDNAKAPQADSGDVETQLEAETGHDVVQSGTNPPTYVETDKPAARKPVGSSRTKAK